MVVPSCNKLLTAVLDSLAIRVELYVADRWVLLINHMRICGQLVAAHVRHCRIAIPQIHG